MTDENIKVEHGVVSERLFRRAERLKQTAKIYIGLIFTVLLFGAFVFVFAPAITDYQTDRSDQFSAAIIDLENKKEQAENEIREIQGELSDLQIDENNSQNINKEISKLESEIKILEDNIKEDIETVCALNSFKEENNVNVNFSIRSSWIKSTSVYFETSAATYYFLYKKDAEDCISKLDESIILEIDSKQSDISNLRDNIREANRAYREANSEKISAANSRTAILNEEISAAAKLIGDLKIMLVANNSGISDQINLDNFSIKTPEEVNVSSLLPFIQTNITRLGSVILMIYLVSILVSQHRTCIYLAAFYESIADCLDRFGIDSSVDNIGKAMRFMTPNSIILFPRMRKSESDKYLDEFIKSKLDKI